MDKINVLITVTGISLFISLFLAFFLLTVRTKYRLSNFLFAAFLIVNTMDISEPLVSLIMNGPSNLGMFRNTLAFLQIPAFYLYVLSVCYSDFRLKPKHWLHLLPFLVVNMILLPRFYMVDAASKIDFIINRQSRIELQVTHILFHIQFVVYFVAVFVLLRKAKKLYRENYTGTSINSYNWLFQFTSVLTALYVIVIIKNIFKFSDYPYVSEWIKVGILVFQLLIICWYLFKALNHPGLFRNIDSKLKLVSDIISDEKNSEAPMINENEWNTELIKLKKYMEEEKPFLDPSLTIQNVSDSTQIPVRDLSLLINHQLGQHFFDFINTYRIEEAKVILKDPAKTKVTVLEILYEVGFNSKSSFNTAFKKYTDLTPTLYRKQLLSSDL